MLILMIKVLVIIHRVQQQFMIIVIGYILFVIEQHADKELVVLQLLYQ